MGVDGKVYRYRGLGKDLALKQARDMRGFRGQLVDFVYPGVRHLQRWPEIAPYRLSSYKHLKGVLADYVPDTLFL